MVKVAFEKQFIRKRVERKPSSPFSAFFLYCLTFVFYLAFKFSTGDPMIVPDMSLNSARCLQSTVGERRKEMTNRTEEERRPKESTKTMFCNISRVKRLFSDHFEASQSYAIVNLHDLLS